MCGRFANPCTAETLEESFAAAANLLMAKGWSGGRYNAAPTQALPIVRGDPAGGRQLDLMGWGWKPAWMRTGLLVNARGEEAAAKPTFASALRLRRCLVPATAFYEWRESDKQPFAYQRPDGLPYAIGGLWDPAGAADGSPAFLLLTVEANAVVAPCHHRMALIVPRLRWDAWLDPSTDALQVATMIEPSPAEELVAVQVSKLVSSVRNDGPELLVPWLAP